MDMHSEVFQNIEFEKAFLAQHNGVMVINEEIPIMQYLNKFDKKQKIKFIIASSSNRFKLWAISIPLISEEKAKKLIGDDLIFINEDCSTGMCKTLFSARQIINESLKPTYTIYIYDSKYDLVRYENQFITVNSGENTFQTEKEAREIMTKKSIELNHIIIGSKTYDKDMNLLSEIASSGFTLVNNSF